MSISGISPEAAKAYLEEKAAMQAERKWNLDVPEDVVYNEKGYGNWSETGIVVGVGRKVIFSQKSQCDLTLLSVKFKIVGEETKNLGRITSKRMFFNENDEVAENHLKMNEITQKSLLSLGLGMGLDISKGLSESTIDLFFPAEGSTNKSPLLGTVWFLGMSDCNIEKKKYKGENAQDINAMIRITADDAEEDDDDE
jgi:hypothetical protein